ncbi:dioxygenase [Streptomyces sp. LX-29]|uniref:dioxygenase family protein n=1 Tax=Streptomyces sp. LX-29 TaxID=2900152 RepID=UPI00240D00ED|nr:dioxygenase [Streptomyces sp. LX-29]WFB10666.1 dioxygenase [Streptomyces sp. LX-29]
MRDDFDHGPDQDPDPDAALDRRGRHAADGDAARPDGHGAATAAEDGAGTPAGHGGQETPTAAEGPLFKPETPERTDLIAPGVRGVELELAGHVYDLRRTPVPGALIEFWQCDQNGDYDTSGFSLRGHQYTTHRGAFRLRTVIPRDYWGRWGRRAPHLHTRIHVPGGPLLVTQLYFPDDTQAYGRDFAALNAMDPLIDRACTLTLTGPLEGRYRGTFDFVVRTGGH